MALGFPVPRNIKKQLPATNICFLLLPRLRNESLETWRPSRNSKNKIVHAMLNDITWVLPNHRNSLSWRLMRSCSSFPQSLEAPRYQYRPQILPLLVTSSFRFWPPHGFSNPTRLRRPFLTWQTNLVGAEPQVAMLQRHSKYYTLSESHKLA